jgi:subtilisin
MTKATGSRIVFRIGVAACGLMLLAAVLPNSVAAAEPGALAARDQRSGGFESPRLMQKAEKKGSVRVIVGLRTNFIPEGRLGTSEVATQRDDIKFAEDQLHDYLDGTPYRVVRDYEFIPYLALEISPEALERLQRSDRVTSILEDRLSQPQLSESAPIVQAPTMWNSGYTGAGKVVAVLDTGVDKAHPFLGGRVVAEACYSAGNDCPNGSWSQTGAGSGVPCTYASSCAHGTHVSGIAAGSNATFSGVAKGASVMAVQVFSRFTGQDCAQAGQDPCALSYNSDQIAGLERVYALRSTHSFASVNISIGGGRYTSNCDAALASYKAAIDNLRSTGIATVISSSNSGHTDALGSPACISSAVSVGSTTKTDAVSSFSNSASFLSLLAPGSSIYSSLPSGTYGYKNGTSMAAPHVAGAWALLKQQSPSASVAAILNALQSTGLSVTDTRAAGGVTRPRIRIAAASAVLSPGVVPANDHFANSQQIAGATATGSNVGASKETGEPNHAGNVGGKSVWYRWSPASSGSATIDTLGSGFDTTLGVYSGGAVDSLSLVASNDDIDGTNTRSRVTFNASAGTTYRIAVDGYNAGTGAGAASGAVTLNASLAEAAPHTSIDSGPTVSSSSATFTFSSSKPNSTFACSLDGAAYSACTSPKQYTELVPGSHTFRVRATDSSGTTDPTPAERIWTVVDATTVYQPDGLIKRSGDYRYQGNNVYNLTGFNQTWKLTARRGSTRTFLIRVQNDGEATDSFSIVGSKVNRFTTKYFFGARNITTSVIAGEYSTGNLAPGATRTIKMTVLAKRNARRTTHLWRIHAVSYRAQVVNDQNVRDVVRLSFKVR